MLEDASGVRIKVFVRLGLPYQVGDLEGACPCEIEGFEPRHPDIRGVSSLQATCLALALLRSRLNDFVVRGGKVLLAAADGTAEPIELDTIFGRH